MDILEFAGEVIVLSMSGVLSPGPLFLANLIYGSRDIMQELKLQMVIWQ